MSFAQVKKLHRKIGFRLAFGISTIFVIFSICVLVTVYSVLSRSLVKRDHDLIQAKMREYTGLFENGGKEALEKIRLDAQLQIEAAPFLIRLANDDGATLFEHAPMDFKKYDAAAAEKRLVATGPASGWQSIESVDDEDRIEYLTDRVEKGFLLQVGKSTDERDDLLEQITGIFAVAIFAVSLVSVAVSIWFSRRVLMPVRDLIGAIRSFEKSDFRARVTESKTGDEIELLTQLFNQLAQRIESLIRGMRETLDYVAHDLRTPLTRFRSSAELALQGSGGPEAHRDALAEGLESVGEILVLVDSLMDISEAESGAIRIKLENLDVRTLFSEVGGLYEEVADEKGVGLSFLRGEPVFVEGDRTLIKRVIANLVDNAIKYTPRGGRVGVRARLDREKAGGGGFVEIIVEDTGYGIPESEQSRIWERLFRGDSSRSERGLGLGLTLVRSIVKAHGGSVSLESSPGKGSEFVVRLPVTERTYRS